MIARDRTYARYTAEAVELLGKMIKAARKQRKMTETELAERVGIARSTLQRLEGGDPKVELGIALEAAHLVGIKLFESDERDMRLMSGQVNEKLALLPKYVRRSRKSIKDDF